ncbi:probable disease resistance protein At4g27220 [Arachis duranensis]|uniref:Probable disease resistance protein At4g27220 n=1 Tax=Arachis duranensis TaxID=130453 RepID=A0A6P4BV89_ARADU|nr:probable disease resistance protein At4g27220 [Arachis duranensis]
MAGFGNIASNLGDLATEVAKQVGGEALASRLVSVRNSGENFELLKQELQGLLALKEDKEKEVQGNRHKDTSSAYRLWSAKVFEVAAETRHLIAKYETSTWSWKHPTLSPEIEKRLKDVQQLVEKGNSVDCTVDKPPDRILKVFYAPEIMGYKTLQSALENIVDLLKSSKIQTIGVAGMKGVGKTALMQNLNNHDVVAEIFDIVIFIRLSADHTDHELQCKIAKRLRVDTEVINDPEEVARIIHEELQTKKYLLILDGTADEINLSQLGIPCNDNHSKVIITAQHRQVCTLNGAERMIEVGLLSRDEAWKMFCNTVGPVIDLPDIPEIARRVCDKCSCLPLLIQKIARSFRLKKSASSWRVGLEDLEERWPDYENEGVSELYSFLTFCYDELKDENKQKCFLYASLYPANCKVYTDYLVECWAAQNFLGDVNNTRKYQKARDRGQAILEHLTDVSLLDRGKQMIYVSMNDCMQQLALHISSKHPECSSYVQTREKLGDAQESLSWEKARWVSMIDTNLKNLPTNQDCSMLLMLLLQKNPDLSTIPQLFFKKHMRSLLVLDLYGTGIGWLPSSMSKLTGLKGLYLNHCKHLRELHPAIRTLELLEFLDIRGTQISFIPSLIGYLINLRCLRVPYIRSGDQNMDQTGDLDPCAILRLTRLEELVIEVVSFEDWCSNAENVMAMLTSLEHLTNLQCSFPSSNILDRFLRRRSGRQFTSFQFFVGCPNSKRPQILESFEYRISKYIRYDNSKHENTFSISEILPQTHAVELVHFKEIKEISDLGKENLEQIRGLSLEECNEIHTLIGGNANGSRDEISLPNLEQLLLNKLLELNCVFRGPLNPGSLSKLKVLTLKNCPFLITIFCNGAIQYLSELQKLEIHSCFRLEELIPIIEVGEDVLPKLEVLLLANLPRLRFVTPDMTLRWSSLERVNIYRCPLLKSLPFCKDKETNLRSIRGEQGWWNELKWRHKAQYQDIFLPSNELTF